MKKAKKDISSPMQPTNLFGEALPLKNKQVGSNPDENAPKNEPHAFHKLPPGKYWYKGAGIWTKEELDKYAPRQFKKFNDNGGG